MKTKRHRIFTVMFVMLLTGGGWWLYGCTPNWVNESQFVDPSNVGSRTGQRGDGGLAGGGAALAAEYQLETKDSFVAGNLRKTRFTSKDRLLLARGVRKNPPGSPGTKAQLIALSPNDELWVISKPTTVAPPTDDETPGCGALVGVLANAPQKRLPMPLKHTAVSASISAYIAIVNVTQQFHNPYDGKIEAAYVFPLPQNAAVSEFVMVVGERRIRGIIRERAEAERIYHEARRQGHVASLLTQERPNIFTQKVANIEPGKQIDIRITYFHTLAYEDGYYAFRFPMVVGPRFNPPHMAGGGVGAVGRGRGGQSGQKVEVQYLRPNERSGHDISLSVDINAGVPIEQIECTSHAINTDRTSPDRAAVTIAAADRIPNKDFVLRYRVAGQRIKSSVLVHRDERVPGGGYFTLMLFPPADIAVIERRAMEMIFVLDCSGSMNGFPIEKAKGALCYALNRLRPGDSFQVIRFSNNASKFGPAPVEATAANIRRAVKYVKGLKGSGGTMMIEGIRAALDFPHDPHRLRFVSFMTDGFIGNEPAILGAVHKKLGPSRVFSFGVGQAPNTFLLDRMAVLGRGAVAYVGLHDDAERIMADFWQRISHAALTDVEVDLSSMQVSDVYPRRVPDLFVGRPVILTGRFRGEGKTMVRVTGRAAGCNVQYDIPVDLSDPVNQHAALAGVWARMQIAELTNQCTYTDDPHGELTGMIRQTALDYHLMSAYTSFVAVDSATKTAGAYGTTVNVAVPVPEGVRYETTVNE